MKSLEFRRKSTETRREEYEILDLFFSLTKESLVSLNLLFLFSLLMNDTLFNHNVLGDAPGIESAYV